MHMLEIARYYQRQENRELERQQAKKKPKGLLRRLLGKK
jgi:hypothetical protein